MKIENLIAIDLLLTHKKADEGLNTFKKNIDSFKDAVNKQSEFHDPIMHDNLTKWGELGGTIAKTGDTLTKTLTVPVAGALAGAAKAAMEYESAFAGVEKTVDGTREELDDLSDAIKRMSTEMPAATSEIAGVAEVAGQLGIALPDIEEFSKVMIDLGISTSLSSEQAAESLARLFNIMGNTSDEYERAGSVLVELGNNSATSEKDILQLTMRLAAAGKQAGMTTQDVMGIATGMSSMGISAEAGGGSMSKFISNMNNAVSVGTGRLKELEQATGHTWREMEIMAENSPRAFKTLADSVNLPSGELKRFIKAGKDAEQMADIMDISVEELAKRFRDDAAGSVVAFIEGLQDVENGLNSATLSGKDANAILTEMGITEVRLRDTLLRTANAGELMSDSLAMANKEWATNTALTKEASIRYETFESQWEMMKNAFKLIAINLGEQMLPMMKDLVKWLQEFAEKIANMDPKKFQALAKSLMAVAAAGPGLKIAGTAIKGFSSVGKYLNAGTMGMKAMNAQTALLTKSYQDGGWTAPALNFLKQFGFQMRENGTVMRKDGATALADLSTELVRHNKVAKESVLSQMSINTEMITGSKAFGEASSAVGGFSEVSGPVKIDMDQMTKAITGPTGLSKAFTTLTTNPIFQGAIWVGVAAYAVDVINEFGFLREAAGLIIDIFLDLFNLLKMGIGGISNFISKITDGAASFKDLAIAAGGVALVMTGIAPVAGAALAALAGFKAVGGWIRGLIKPAEEAEESIQQVGHTSEVTAEEMENLKNKVDGVDTAYKTFVSESAPAVQQAYQDIHDKMIDAKLTPDDKELQMSLEDYTTYTDTLLDHHKGSRESLREDLKEHLRNTGELEKESGEAQLKEFDEQTKIMVGSREELNKDIDELLKKKFDNSQEWLDSDEEQLLLAMKELEDATIEFELGASQRELDRLKVRLENKRLMGVEITKEDQEELLALQEEARLDQEDIALHGLATQLEILEQKKDEGLIKEDDYQKQLLELHTNYFQDSMDGYAAFAADHIEAVTGMSKEEIDDLMNKKNELIEIEQELYDEKGKFRTDISAAEQAELLEKQGRLKEEIESIEENIELEEEMWQELANFFKDKLPEEFQEGIDEIADAKSFFDVFRMIDNTTVELGDAAENIALELGEGYVDGIESKEADVDEATTGIFSRSITRLKKWLGIKSPSRMMMEIGAFMGDGVVDGFNSKEKGITSAINGVMEKARDIASSIASKFTSIGSNIASGVSSGIRNGANAVTNAARNMANSAFNTAKNALGIKSPSRKFMEIGAFTSEGLAVGIEDEAKQAIKAARTLSQDIQDAMEIDEMDHTATTRQLRQYTEVGAGDNLVSSVRQLMDEVRGEQGQVHNYNAPLINVDNMTVRSEEDVRKVSRELYNLMGTNSRAKGKI